MQKRETIFSAILDRAKEQDAGEQDQREQHGGQNEGHGQLAVVGGRHWLAGFRAIRRAKPPAGAVAPHVRGSGHPGLALLGQGGELDAADQELSEIRRFLK